MSENNKDKNYQLSINHYPLMKSSGIDWIGDIPKHWDCKRIKYKITYQKGQNPKEYNFNDKGEPYLTMEYLRGNPKQTYFVENFQDYLNVENDEILLLWDGSNAGEFIRSRAGILSSTMATLYLSELDKNFAWYYLKTYERILKQSTIGMGIPHVNGEDFKNNLFLIPTLPEQTAIADYLDEKTAQIDKLIVSKRRLIELLKEERLCVINQAVTRGINPHAKLKPSGIAWLGDIPEHWEVKKLKFVVNGIVDTEHKTVPFYDDEEFYVARTSDIRNGVLYIEKMRRTNREGFEEWTQRETPLEGDIIFTREAPAGEACVIPQNLNVCLGQRTVLFKTNQNIMFPQLTVHQIYSDVVKEYINQLSQGSTVSHFNMADIKNIPLILPPIEEQKQIVEFIESATGKIDATIAVIEKEIGFLREYRTALISEVVTGKMKVMDNG